MKNNKKAFTLIELLVMVALISIVSATIFYNYNVSDNDYHYKLVEKCLVKSGKKL